MSRNLIIPDLYLPTSPTWLTGGTMAHRHHSHGHPKVQQLSEVCTRFV